MFDSTGNKLVLDTLLEKIESIHTDVVPGSYSKPIVSGIENNPVQIRSNGNDGYSACYTTVPLTPLEGRVLDVSETTIHCDMILRYKVTIGADLKNTGYVAVGPSSYAELVKQIQFIINSNVFMSTSFNRTEAAIGRLTLEEDIVQDPEYATVDKIVHFKPTPFTYIKLDSNTEYEVEQRLDFTIDLSRLYMPISNIDYITSNMGNLRLKLYFNDIHEALKFVYIPASLNATAGDPKATGVIELIEMKPIAWGLEQAVACIKAADGNATTSTVKFEKGITTNKLFLETKVVEICQSCFDITPESWSSWCNYCAKQGLIILPTNMFVTQQVNQTEVNEGSNSLTAQLSANNINKILITYQPNNSPTTFINPLPKSYQVRVDGTNLNQTPYPYLDGRAITDMIEVMSNPDDAQEVNHDYRDSIIPLFNNVKERGATTEYNTTYDWILPASEITTFTFNNQQRYKPNGAIMAFNTAVEGAFHTGVCVLEQSSGRASHVRIDGNITPVTLSQTYASTCTIGNPCAESNHTPVTKTNCYVTAFTDACIVLQYDAMINDVTAAYVNFAKPYGQ